MSILRPRFIGPYGTEDGEHNALYFQREVQDFMKDVLSGVTVEDDETERLHVLFNIEEDNWYRKMACDICRQLRTPSGTSGGFVVIDGLRATLSSWTVPYSSSQWDAAYEQTQFYRLVSSRLRWLVKHAGQPVEIDRLKHVFLHHVLYMFRVNPRPSDLLANSVAGNGEQFQTHKDVLGAIRSLINTWDNEHHKLWAEYEEKEKGFQQLRIEIESLRQKLPQSTEAAGEATSTPAQSAGTTAKAKQGSSETDNNLQKAIFDAESAEEAADERELIAEDRERAAGHHDIEAQAAHLAKEAAVLEKLEYRRVADQTEQSKAGHQHDVPNMPTTTLSMPDRIFIGPVTSLVQTFKPGPPMPPPEYPAGFFLWRR